MSISATGWVNTDPLFMVGNGAVTNARHNAITSLKNGYTGINTSSPQAMLHVKDSRVLFSGTEILPASPGDPPVSGAGSRMMWYPDKAALRAGIVDYLPTVWDKDSIGRNSFATSSNTKARGNYSTAMGTSTVASGIQSMAIGASNIASGNVSFASGGFTTASGAGATTFGYNTTASGLQSTAFGLSTIASRDHSFAAGEYTIAGSNNAPAFGKQTIAIGLQSFAAGTRTIAARTSSFSVGYYNDTTNVNIYNRIFAIGNGITSLDRSNALTVLNGGEFGIGTSQPAHRLRVVNDIGGGASGFAQGIVVESTNTNTGEAGGSFKNNGTNGTGNKFWITGLNQNRNFAWAYGTGFAGSVTKMLLDSTGNLGLGTITPTATLEVVDTTILGANGTSLNEVIKQTVNKDVASDAANASLTELFAVTNAQVNSTVYISPASSLSDGLIIAYARVSAAGLVEVKFTNTTAGIINPPAMNFFITVIR